MARKYKGLCLLSTIILVLMACRAAGGLPVNTTSIPTRSPTPAATLTPLPPIAVKLGEENPDEPVYITGEIPYSNPFFVSSLAEPFVMLEDEAGFVGRDREFKFPLQGQVIGPVEVHPDKSLTYDLALPEVPQGTQVDVDNNGQQDKGVQVFAIAYWSNTWGGPFIEERDGSGWSNAYASTVTDNENNDEIKGGTIIVWSPDEQQGFPTGFGSDGLLFTADDPVGKIPAGYSLVDLNQTPFRVYKEARPVIKLNEGAVAVNDYSNMSYRDAFEAMFKKVSVEYPFTEAKGVDWQALHDKFAPRFDSAKDTNDLYRALRDFGQSIPDTHIDISPTINQDVFIADYGGGFGLILTELSDKRVIASKVIPGSPADQAGIKAGTEIITWDGKPIGEAISQAIPFFGSYSTDFSKRLMQVISVTRVPPGKKVVVTFSNSGGSPIEATMQAVPEVDSINQAFPNVDELALPVDGKILEDSGLAYIKIPTFSEDDNLSAHLWDHFIQGLIDNKVPGLIIDLRSNGGGNAALPLDFAGYFLKDKIDLYRSLYYSERTGKFEYSGSTAQITPGPVMYKGPIAVLVSPDCVSACEEFAYALQHGGRSTLVGHYPTAGAYGEVGRGQYKLPDDINIQFPTGRSETMDGKLLIEGVGVTPDITMPVTEQSALNQSDDILDAAIKVLKDKTK